MDRMTNYDPIREGIVYKIGFAYFICLYIQLAKSLLLARPMSGLKL